MTIRVIIADDHPVVRRGVKNVLLDAPDIEVVGEAISGDEALEECLRLKPDILLLDINMPGLKAVNVVRSLREGQLALKVVVLTGYRDPENVLGMIQAGAKGYLLKDEEPTVLIDAVRAVHSGKTWVSPTAMEGLIDPVEEEKNRKTIDELTNRESEVLLLIAQGIDNHLIAEQLSIAEGTVKNHIVSIYEKLGLHSRAEAVTWAWKHQLL
jgi:two-component system, NarL family, response regulator DegU